MYKEYKIEDNLGGLQDILIRNSIQDVSNIQLLKSEEAIKNVIESYIDKLHTAGTKLTDMTKHMVEPKTLINKDQFNNLFNDLYIDIKTLYGQTTTVEKVLDLNLSRNKKFYSVLKKRMRELWNKLHITRINMSDHSLFDESYFESFSTQSSLHEYLNVDLNKKIGHLTLIPIKKDIHTKSYKIKNAKSTTYPVHNVKGGVRNSTNILNTLEESYKTGGQRDMLQNGLWKEQLFCADIPELTLNLDGGDLNDTVDGTFVVSTIGVISVVDIEYIYPVDFNSIELDLFGEKMTSLAGVLYKSNDDDLLFKSITKTGEETEDIVDRTIMQEKFDLIKIENIDITKIKHLRLIFNQKEYDVLDNSTFANDAIDDKIYDDLSERRYSVVSLSNSTIERPLQKEDGVQSLYDDIVEIIETTKSIETMLRGIFNVINPPPKIVDVEFSKLLKYELGTWSIEPSLKQFVGHGVFKSGDYRMLDKALISATLIAKQETLGTTTSNWYISNKEQPRHIPIMEQGSTLRKEPGYIIRPKFIESKSAEGKVLHLDFPVKESDVNDIKLIIKGEEKTISDYKPQILNSTSIILEDIKDSLLKDIVVKYYPALYESCYVYTLTRTDEVDEEDLVEYEVVANSESILSTLVDIIFGIVDVKYSVNVSSCTLEEYKSYFGEGKSQQALCIKRKHIDAWNSLLTFKLQDFLNIKIVNSFKHDGYSTAYDSGLDYDVIVTEPGTSIIPNTSPFRVARRDVIDINTNMLYSVEV